NRRRRGLPGLLLACRSASVPAGVEGGTHRPAGGRTGLAIIVVHSAVMQRVDPGAGLAAVIIDAAVPETLDRRHRFPAVVVRTSPEQGARTTTVIAPRRSRL